MPLAINELSAQQVATINISIKDMIRLLGKLYEFKVPSATFSEVNPAHQLQQILLTMNANPITKELIYKPTGKEPKVNGEIDVSRLDNNQVYMTLTDEQQTYITRLKFHMTTALKTLAEIAKNVASPEVITELTRTTEQVKAANEVLKRVAVSLYGKAQQQPISKEMLKENYDPSESRRSVKIVGEPRPPQILEDYQQKSERQETLKPPPKPPKIKHDYDPSKRRPG